MVAGSRWRKREHGHRRRRHTANVCDTFHTEDATVSNLKPWQIEACTWVPSSREAGLLH